MKNEQTASLSNRETEILELVAIGLSAEEIADKLCRSPETIRKTISNIKIKKNLQKATELAAEYWCSVFGTSLEEQKKQILAAMMLAVVIFSLPFEHYEAVRIRRSYRRIYKTETKIIYQKEA